MNNFNLKVSLAGNVMVLCYVGANARYPAVYSCALELPLGLPKHRVNSLISDATTIVLSKNPDLDLEFLKAGVAYSSNDFISSANIAAAKEAFDVELTKAETLEWTIPLARIFCDGYSITGYVPSLN